jgi:hypothetical protein
MELVKDPRFYEQNKLLFMIIMVTIMIISLVMSLEKSQCSRPSEQPLVKLLVIVFR